MSNSTQMASGTIWNTIERFSVIGIQLVCTFVLARYLSPSAFGLMGMLVVFTLIGNTIAESGFSQALIRESEVTHSMLSTVFWSNLLLSLAIYGLLWLSAPLIAQFYNQPELITLSRATFLTIPIGALSLVHVVMCTRQLAFRRLCIVSLIASLTSCIVAVLAAWLTHSVWALALQNITVYALRTLGLWFATQFRPKLTFDFTALKQLFAFSRNILVTGIIGNLFNNIYTLLIGRNYGASATGFYAQADRMRQVTSASLTNVVQSVSYPILSHIHHDKSSDMSTMRQSYRRLILVTLVVVGLTTTLLMCISEDLMQLLMGESAWRTSGRYFYALGVVGILFPLHAVNQNILLVHKLGRTILLLEVARRTLMIAIIAIALQFGIDVFVWSYAIYSFLLLFVNLYVCGRPIGYSLHDQLRDISPILLRIIIILFAAQCTNHLLALQPLLFRCTVTFLLSLLLVFMLFRHHPAVIDVKDIIMRMRKRIDY